jgi:3-deoxy-D-manno-octulosonic-acid transferase
LLERVARALPDATILLTHMTATGRAAGHALYGDSVQQAWLPYDVPFAVDAFLARFRPRVGLLMETEVWPNLVAACRERDIPLCLVNARLSERSAAGYARFAALTRPMFASLAGVAAQTAEDAARLSGVGARDVTVTGNLKFDVALTVPIGIARPRVARPVRRIAAGLSRRVDARRRGGAARRRAGATCVAGAIADAHRAPPSAALRRRRRSAARTRRSFRPAQR